MVNASDVLDRIKTILNMRKDIELARHLKRTPNNIYAWRERNTLDFRLIIDTFWNEDLNYIFKGDHIPDNHLKDINSQNNYNENNKQQIIYEKDIKIKVLEEIILKIKQQDNK